MEPNTSIDPTPVQTPGEGSQAPGVGVKTKVATKVSTKVRVAILVGAAAIAAAAAVAPALRTPSIKIVNPAARSIVSGVVTLEAMTATPKGFKDATEVVFRVSGLKDTFPATYSAYNQSWRAQIDTTKVKDGQRTFLATAKFPPDGTTRRRTPSIGSANVRLHVRNPVAQAPAPELRITHAIGGQDDVPGIVLGGTSDAHLGSFKFEAIGADVEVRKLKVRPGTPAGVESLALYDGSTLLAGPVAVGSDGARFEGMHILVPKDAPRTITVRGKLRNVGPAGVPTGTDVSLELSGDTSDAFIAGNTTVAGFSSIAMGVRKIMVKSKPTIGMVYAGGTTLASGTNNAYRFTVTADAAGDVALKQLHVQVVNGTAGATLMPANAATSSIRRVGTGTDLPGSATMPAACQPGTGCFITVLFANEEVIAAGTTRAYDVRIAVNGSLVDGDSVATSLLGDSFPMTASLQLRAPGIFELGNGIGSFIWSDMSAVPHDDVLGGSPDWSSGFGVLIPQSIQTLFR